jgi:hypothetical protein
MAQVIEGSYGSYVVFLTFDKRFRSGVLVGMMPSNRHPSGVSFPGRRNPTEGDKPEN